MIRIRLKAFLEWLQPKQECPLCDKPVRFLLLHVVVASNGRVVHRMERCVEVLLTDSGTFVRCQRRSLLHRVLDRHHACYETDEGWCIAMWHRRCNSASAAPRDRLPLEEVTPGA